MFEDKYLVTHNHSHQCDDTHHGGKSQRAVHQPKTYKGTRNHESEGGDADQRDAVLLEVEQQEEEHDNHRDGYTTENLRQRLLIVFYLATHLGTHALGQVYLILHDFCHTSLHRSSIDALSKLRRHRDAALSTTMHDATLRPLGLYLGNLTKRNRGVN